MSLSELNATIREIEARLAQYEASSPLDHSTPRVSKSQSTASSGSDSGIITMKSRTTPSALEHKDERRSVKFTSNDSKYDISKYLPKDEQLERTSTLYHPKDDANVTTRRKLRSSSNEQQRAPSQNEEPSRKQLKSGEPRRMKVKPATYDGTTSWLDFKSHFEACAKLGQWSDGEKGLYLSVSLRGLAQGILGN